MDQDHEPRWDATGPRDRLLCVACVADMLHPHTSVRVHYREGPEHLLYSGLQLTEQARRARADGHPIEINNDWVGVFADTTVQGYALCAAHAVRVLADGFPPYWR